MFRLARWVRLTALLALMLGPGSLVLAQVSPTPADRPGTRSPAGKGLDSLPLPAQATISASLGRDDPAYHAGARGSGLQVANPRHGLSANFTPAGMQVQRGTLRWGLTLTGVGYAETLGPVALTAPQVTANRVEYRRGPLTEWYVNGPLGLEQGFTLAAPPEPRAGGPLTVALILWGNLTAALDPGGESLTLQSADGPAVLRYRGLTASDATGRILPAWLELRGTQLLLRVDAADARYPIVVDPLIQQAKLTVLDGALGDNFGLAVAIDGDTVVVGAPFAKIGSNSAQGAAYVFNWATLTETAKLTASDGAAGDHFGSAVAISGDTVVVGAPSVKIGSNNIQGAAYVFVKPPAGWATLTETAKLTASDGAANDNFGFAVALGGDSLVVGAYGAKIGSKVRQGAAYVFVTPPTGWAGTPQHPLHETAKLTASDGAAGDNFGFAVALSGDSLVVGAYGPKIGSNLAQGAAYLFVKPPAGWATLTETAKLTASDGAAIDHFGSAVALGGATVVVGAPNAAFATNPGPGAAYVFVSPQGPTLQPHLNQSAFHSGGQLIVSATVTPGPTPVTADVYTAVQLPNGSLLFLQGDGSITPTLQPIVRNWTISPFTGQIFTYTFGGGEPVGNYGWLAVFTEPGTLNFIGPIISAPFSFSP